MEKSVARCNLYTAKRPRSNLRLDPLLKLPRSSGNLVIGELRVAEFVPALVPSSLSRF